MSPGNVRQCAPTNSGPPRPAGHAGLRPFQNTPHNAWCQTHAAIFQYDTVRVIVARRYVISGRVQGVGFRYFTEATAAREGILGWVRNTPDGRVEVVAEGDAEALERFERSLRHGPRGARVERVDVDDTSPTGETGFTVK